MEEGYYRDDGTKVDIESIPIPPLCLSCLRSQGNETACSLTRIDQASGLEHGELFCCFAYEPNDPMIDRESIYKEMDEYLANKKSLHHEFGKVMRCMRHDHL